MSFQSYSTFVFYNSKATPTLPSYSVIGPIGDPLRTVTITNSSQLAGPSPAGALKADPGAVFLNNKIYLFCRRSDNTIFCMTLRR